MEDRKLELAFIDNHGKVYPLDMVTRGVLAGGLEKITRNCKETAIVERTKIEPSLPLFSCSWKTKRKRFQIISLALKCLHQYPYKLVST